MFEFKRFKIVPCTVYVMHIEVVLIYLYLFIYYLLFEVHSNKTLTRYFTDKYNDIWQLCWAQAQVMNFDYPQI